MINSIVLSKIGGYMKKLCFLVVTLAMLISSVSFAVGQKGDMKASVLFPGLFAGNKTIDLMMTGAVEGEYFLYDRLSVGLRIRGATDFESNAGEIDSLFISDPFVRYQFKINKLNNWYAYAQFLVGIALLDGDEVAADISFPSGGVFWQWTNNISVGADLGLHLLVHSDTAVAFQIGPRFSYNF